MRFFAVFWHDFLGFGCSKSFQQSAFYLQKHDRSDRRLRARGPHFCCRYVVLATNGPPPNKETPISMCGYQAQIPKFRKICKIFEMSIFEKNQSCLRGRQTVPIVRTYIIFMKIDALDLVEFWKLLGGSSEISGAFQSLLKIYWFSQTNILGVNTSAKTCFRSKSATPQIVD